MRPRVPSTVATALKLLRFHAAPERALDAGTDWDEVLGFLDRSQLTLVFGAVAGEALPSAVRDRIARNLEENAERLSRIQDLQDRIAQWLDSAAIEFLFLKGTTQYPHFLSDPRFHVQYDVDLFCPGDQARRAWDLLIGKGYAQLPGVGKLPTDHLPTLIFKTGWQWRGDHFDPDAPLSIELHFRFWDEATERLKAPGVEEFWQRRVGRALHPADALAYTSLHSLRHLLRGSISPHHVYELAWFLDSHSGDIEFWKSWHDLHPPELRRLEAVSFRLAQAWFDCDPGSAAEEEMARLPDSVRKWFDMFAASPLEGLFHPNKDELWLHLALVESGWDVAAAVRRKLLPARFPGPVDDTVLLPDAQITTAHRLRKYVRYAGFLAARAAHHARSIPSLLGSGIRWKLGASGLSAQYWAFLSASSLFNLGMFVYVLLYNLYLVDLGFREDFIGQVSSAQTAGSVAGVLPAAILARRYGLNRLLFGCFAGIGAISIMRALVIGASPLLVFAFLSGAAFSLFAVALAPSIAQLTSEKARSTGFSISTASSIALGILGGWLGGHLPGWLGGKRPAMLAGCALVALALWPVARLKIPAAPAEGTKLYPRSRFVFRFLIVLAIWNLATGSFNPFFNTYFARLGMPVERIGIIFSGSQLAQVAALLLAPLLLRKMGLVKGTAAMLMATCLSLGVLAAGPSGWAAAGVFATYMACQWMSEPGINTLVMGRVREPERGGAAALMMLVAFAAQFVAASAAGHGIARFGYSALLACAAGLAAVAAVAFRFLPAGAEDSRVISGEPPRLIPASAPDTARD
ncbi:MAG: MFS transporter [Bryobacteraceae bacterium]